MERQVNFKYVKPDGTIELGVPDDVIAETGNCRDGGCELNFKTSMSSIGITERFSLYLFAEDVRAISFAIWEAYMKTEPTRAKRDFEKLCEKMVQG